MSKDEQLVLLKNHLVDNAANHLCRMDSKRLNGYDAVVTYFKANFGTTLSAREIVSYNFV